MNVRNLIWGLEELSDKALQEKLWTGTVEGEMSSFVEAICSVFDDSGLSRVLDSSDPMDEISPEIRERAIRLGRLIKQVPQSATPLEIIQCSVMDEVRTLAGELLTLVRKNIPAEQSEFRRYDT
ncbi:MAG TPA: hypothetical protein VJL82_03545 [Rhizomicrobium sp.]|nr:hypothetical protein [Rhizomicrobium sp.]